MQHPETPERWLEEVWSKLEQAPKRRYDPWRTPVLATVDTEGMPQARTVVLRRAQAALQRLDIHTDSASSKLSDFENQPVVSFCFWDPKRRWQIRAQGSVAIASQKIAKTTFQKLTAHGQKPYCSSPPPGHPIHHPDDTTFNAAPRFTVVRCTIFRLDFLALTQPVHRRWLAEWSNDAWSAHWISP